MNLGKLRFTIDSTIPTEIKIAVDRDAGGRLFRVDLTRFGSVIESHIVSHTIQMDSSKATAIKSASLDFLLLQKAEVFLLRSVVKARDAFDIYLLKERGATLDENLQAHLADTISSNEIEAAQIRERIDFLGSKSCSAQLRSVLPDAVFSALHADSFAALHTALESLYAFWLSR